MSTSESSMVSAQRRSQRIASKNFGSTAGPTHFDLTREETEKATKTQQKPTSSKATSTRQKPKERPRYPNFPLPLGYSIYAELKKEGDLDTIRSFVEDQGFESELDYLKKLEDARLVESGSADAYRQKEMGKQKVDDDVETKEDENEVFIRNFKEKLGSFADIEGNPNMLFRSTQHEKVFNELLKRGVINPRHVDFDLLDAIGMDLREKLARLQLEKFCSDKTTGYAELTAYFYSNLSFLSHDHIRFTVCEKSYDVDAKLLLTLSE